MTRSGYSDDMDDILAFGRWRAQVSSALRGKRGRALLVDLLAALDAMPEKRLIAHDMADANGEACALTAVARYRGVAVEDLNTDGDYDPDTLGGELGQRLDIAQQLALEVMFVNDEAYVGTPEERWSYVRKWAERQIKKHERRDGGAK